MVSGENFVTCMRYIYSISSAATVILGTSDIPMSYTHVLAQDRTSPVHRLRASRVFQSSRFMTRTGNEHDWPPKGFTFFLSTLTENVPRHYCHQHIYLIATLIIQKHHQPCRCLSRLAVTVSSMFVGDRPINQVKTLGFPTKPCWS